jgi:RNA polymerase sigma-70 factor, ECF subfamily
MDTEDHVEALVSRCQRGDRGAFEALFRQFQPRLRYYVRNLNGTGNHADDLLQNVWLKVVRKIDSLNDPQAFVAWLYTIARREVYSQGRTRDPFVELTDEHLELVAENEEPTFDEEDAARIHRTLANLKDSHREILTLSFLEELSHHEIAQVLGVNAGTVKSRVNYAKQALRQALERNHE